MTNTEIPAIVSSLFRYFGRKRGFLVTQPALSGAFDQMVQSAVATHVTIRFVRDRGNGFLEVGKEPHWFSPDLLRLMLQGGEPVDAPENMQEHVSFLTAHITEIETSFSPENRAETLRRLTELSKKKGRIMFPNELRVSQ